MLFISCFKQYVNIFCFLILMTCVNLQLLVHRLKSVYIKSKEYEKKMTQVNLKKDKQILSGINYCNI